MVRGDEVIQVLGDDVKSTGGTKSVSDSGSSTAGPPMRMNYPPSEHKTGRVDSSYCTKGSHSIEYHSFPSYGSSLFSPTKSSTPSHPHYCTFSHHHYHFFPPIHSPSPYHTLGLPITDLALGPRPVRPDAGVGGRGGIGGRGGPGSGPVGGPMYGRPPRGIPSAMNPSGTPIMTTLSLLLL